MSYNTDWLFDDVKRNRAVLEKENSQLSRRNYLRSLFAFYEIVLSNLRNTVTKLLIDEFDLSGQWKLHEISPLLDETPRLSENGQLKLDTNKMPFLPLVAYTLKTYAKQIEFKKDILSDSRWQDFCQSVKIRNRITHPKSQSEMDITDKEIEVIDQGWAWWNEILKDLWKAHENKLINS